MAKKTVFRGSIALTPLKHETCIREGKKVIIFPLDENPSIYYKKNEDGTKTILLDIEVVPTPDSKFGNSHYIRLNVGKANREKYGIKNDQIKDHTPIIGNLKEQTFETRSGNSQASEDMPDFGNTANRQTPKELEEDW